MFDPPVIGPAPKKVCFSPSPPAEISPDLSGVENPEKGPLVFVTCVLSAAGWPKLNPPEDDFSTTPDKLLIFIFPKIDGDWVVSVPAPDVVLLAPKRFELDVDFVAPEGVLVPPKRCEVDVEGAAPEVVFVPLKGFEPDVAGAAPIFVLPPPNRFELDAEGIASEVVLAPPKRLELAVDSAVMPNPEAALIPPKMFEPDVEGTVVPDPNRGVEVACPNSPLLGASLVEVAPKENSGKDFG